MHSHHINVQTEEEIVTVTIGGDGGIPGGFAKLFNRVVDCGAWARLSDAARAAYLPMVRFADQKNQFRIQIGQAALMKYSGLSRSSIKRAMKDLLASRLIALVERGGVSVSGENECSIYQLMVPAERRPMLQSHPAAVPSAAQAFPTLPPPSPSPSPLSAVSPSAVRRGGQSRTPSPSPLAPPGVHGRTPGRIIADPSEGAATDPDGEGRRTHPGVQADAGRGAASGPQFRKRIKDYSNKAEDAADASPEPAQTPADRAAALLRENGVESPADRALAEAHPYERIVDVVATMQYRQSRGKCANPGGFIREALVKQWQTPQAVLDARARAEAKLKREAAEARSRLTQAAEKSAGDALAEEDERRVERAIAALDDEELGILAEAVIEKYQDNPAVLRVLTRRPPRECRLMRMEVANLLASSVGKKEG